MTRFRKEERRSSITTKIQQLVVTIPVENFRRHIHPEDIGSWGRETEHFCGITTMHGPLRAYRGKSMYKWLWRLIMVFSGCLLLYQVGTIVGTHIERPVEAKVTFENSDEGLRFPLVTLCNYNPITREYLERVNGTGTFSDSVFKYLVQSNAELQAFLSAANGEELLKMDGEFQAFQRNAPYTVNDFFEQGGYKCEDLMKMCSFSGIKFDCCSKAQQTVTSLGKCYTISLWETREMKKQISPGEYSGLQILLDSQLGEIYRGSGTESDPVFTNSFENGFRFYVHDRKMMSFITSEGISVSPGSRVYSSIETEKFKRLPQNDWGECVEDWPEKYKDIAPHLPYSRKNCRALCRARYFQQSCGCAPFLYNSIKVYQTCTPLQLYNCLNQTRTSLYKDLETWCQDCPPECENWEYHAYNSYGFNFSEGARKWLKEQNGEWDDQRIEKNFVMVSIFYRELSYTKFEEVKGSDVSTMLSNIGGNMGLCFGMSVITCVEMIIYIQKEPSMKRKVADMSSKGGGGGPEMEPETPPPRSPHKLQKQQFMDSFYEEMTSGHGRAFLKDRRRSRSEQPPTQDLLELKIDLAEKDGEKEIVGVVGERKSSNNSTLAVQSPMRYKSRSILFDDSIPEEADRKTSKASIELLTVQSPLQYKSRSIQLNDPAEMAADQGQSRLHSCLAVPGQLQKSKSVQFEDVAEAEPTTYTTGGPPSSLTPRPMLQKGRSFEADELPVFTFDFVSFKTADAGLQFPLVTVCNYNSIRQSHIQKLNSTGQFSHSLLAYLMQSSAEIRSFLGAAELKDLEKGHAEYLLFTTSSNNTFDINMFFELGGCYTLDMSLEGFHRLQLSPGEYNGLHLILDAQLDEVHSHKCNETDSVFMNAFENGFRYYVHDRHLISFITTEGISVSPGTRVYSSIEMDKFERLPQSDWGKCSEEWPFPPPLPLPYSRKNCKALCHARHFEETCGCAPYIYNTLKAYGLWDECTECATECGSHEFHAYNSYGFGFSKGALKWLRSRDREWTSSYVRENFVMITLFYRHLSYTVFSEVKGNCMQAVLIGKRREATEGPSEETATRRYDGITCRAQLQLQKPGLVPLPQVHPMPDDSSGIAASLPAPVGCSGAKNAVPEWDHYRPRFHCQIAQEPADNE
ncbi:unnamed protein product, partial [Mesorhabditis spiculigera]